MENNEEKTEGMQDGRKTHYYQSCETITLRGYLPEDGEQGLAGGE